MPPSVQRSAAVVPYTWGRYFPAVPYTPDDRRAILSAQLGGLFNTEAGRELLQSTYVEDSMTEALAVHLDFAALVECTAAMNDSALGFSVSVALEMQPKEALACFAAATHEACTSEAGRARGLPQPGAGTLVAVRLVNHADSRVSFRNIKSNTVDKLVTLRGTVTRTSNVRPLVQELSFSCNKCDSLVTCRFVDGQFALPAKCVSQGCRSKSFEAIHSSARCIDQQRVKLEELPTEAEREEGRVPRSLECEFTKGLVGACIPGDVVEVCGLVQYTSADESGPGKRTTYLLYVHALSVLPISRTQGMSAAALESSGTVAAVGGVRTMEAESQSASPPLTPHDCEMVARFVRAMQGGLHLPHLVHSLCPAIKGHELVKCGLVLSLLGGVRKHGGSNERIPVRGDIHLLIVGDPGLGKSQMLKAACAVAPRGIYVCGNSTSSSGLTVSIVKDAGSGDYNFEAGAVVLGDMGVCCIDEFDKMTSQHQALLEAMEQQSVSVAKAGLSASLAARTTVMAAANPVTGHYNRTKTVNENLKMSAAILSRFDLLYILIDRQDDMQDRDNTRQVMARNRGDTLRMHMLEGSRPIAALPATASSTQAPPRRSLTERLKEYQQESTQPLLPHALMRTYLDYARRHVFPVLSPAAAAVLQSFYLRSRQRSRVTDGTPVTARQLESLVRLAEARARVELREEVSAQDAQDVVELMKSSLWDQFSDEKGVVDFGRCGGRSGPREEARRFLAALVQVSETKEKPMFSLGELCAVADQVALKVRDLERFIEQLNDHGDLLKVGRMYTVAASSLSLSQRTSSNRK